MILALGCFNYLNYVDGFVVLVSTVSKICSGGVCSSGWWRVMPQRGMWNGTATRWERTETTMQQLHGQIDMCRCSHVNSIKLSYSDE